LLHPLPRRQGRHRSGDGFNNPSLDGRQLNVGIVYRNDLKGTEVGGKGSGRATVPYSLPGHAEEDIVFPGRNRFRFGPSVTEEVPVLGV